MSWRESILMILIMTIMMGAILSGFFTWQAIGFTDDFFAAWLGRFGSTYVVVLPTVLIVSPIAQWIVRQLSKAVTPQMATPTPREVALAAWRASAAGHGGNDFAPWLATLADDVRITMPLGPFRGETVGKAGAADIYAAIARAQPRLTYEEPLRVTEHGDTVVIEFDDHGTIAGMPYRNRIVGSFDIRQGKVAAYREYFGDIDPVVVAMMTGVSET